jgi:hypothetical protein
MNFYHSKKMSSCFVGTILALASLWAGAQSQPTATAQTQTCERPSNSPSWLPCGPDRVLTEEDLNTYLFKADRTTKMLVTGVPSGRKLRADFYPKGKFEGGIVGGSNIGKAWKFEGAKVCRSYYGHHFGDGKFNCGNFELKAGILYLIDDEGNKSPVTSMELQ